MSVVAVKVYKDRIEISADTIALRKNTKEKICKLFEVNNMVVGSCGSCSEFQLFRIFAKTHQPAGPDEKDIIDFLYEFYSWKRDFAGFESENAYILIFMNKVFHIVGFEVNEVTKYDAIGAGRDYALTALYLGHDTKEAVHITCTLCNLVSEPIQTKVITLK